MKVENISITMDDSIVKLMKFNDIGDVDRDHIGMIKYGEGYLPTAIADFAVQHSSFVFITHLRVDKEKRRQGIGSELLDMVKKLFDSPILLCAGYPGSEVNPNFEPTKMFLDKYIYRLLKFYEGNGFKNVNDKYGQYEEQVTMLYEPNNQNFTRKFD